MFRFLLAAAALLGGAQELTAAPCVAASLATYIGTSCTNFGVTFTAWTYTAGGTSITAADVTVFPSAAVPAFEFTVFTPGGWSAGAGITRTPSIGFTAESSSAATGSYVFLAFGTTSGTGTVAATLNECLGALLAGGCLGTSTALTVTPPTLFASNTFGASFTPIDVRLSMTIIGGTGGAQISSIEAGLFAVPEPRTMSLMTLALGIIALRKRIRS